LALDEMIDRIEVQPAIAEVREIAKVALDRIGFSGNRPLAPAGGNAYVQNNFIGVSADVLAAARRKILEHKTQHEPIAIEASYISAAEGV
jgi:hypothetical protein